MQRQTLKSGSTKSSRGANANAGASASPFFDRTVSSGETLTVSMFTSALDSLKSDICSKIEGAVSGLQADIAAVTDELTSSLATMQRSIDNQEDRLKEVEKSATATSDSVTALETLVNKLKSEVGDLQTKCEDLENRSRRNNIRLVGVPEGLEGTSPTEFISKLLQKLLHLDDVPLLDRAHRSLQAKPRPNQPPRAFVIRVHYFHIRELILRQARQMRSLTVDGRPVHVFPDLSSTEAKRRAAFGDVRKRLRAIHGARFGFRYPAKLRITLPGEAERSFTDHQLAMDYVLSKTANSTSGTSSAAEESV